MTAVECIEGKHKSTAALRSASPPWHSHVWTLDKSQLLPLFTWLSFSDSFTPLSQSFLPHWHPSIHPFPSCLLKSGRARTSRGATECLFIQTFSTLAPCDRLLPGQLGNVPLGCFPFSLLPDGRGWSRMSSNKTSERAFFLNSPNLPHAEVQQQLSS